MLFSNSDWIRYLRDFYPDSNHGGQQFSEILQNWLFTLNVSGQFMKRELVGREEMVTATPTAMEKLNMDKLFRRGRQQSQSWE